MVIVHSKTKRTKRKRFKLCFFAGSSVKKRAQKFNHSSKPVKVRFGMLSHSILN